MRTCAPRSRADQLECEQEIVAIFEHFNSVPEVPRSAFGEPFICYLIMSIAYSQLYWILNRFLDKSFNVPIPHNETATLLYLSMTTISGVGYGGLLPINPYARIIASLETMTGVFFVAVVVARLVASYQPASRSQPEHRSAKDAHHEGIECALRGTSCVNFAWLLPLSCFQDSRSLN
jgi:hypothetical protein